MYSYEDFMRELAAWFRIGILDCYEDTPDDDEPGFMDFLYNA